MEAIAVTTNPCGCLYCGGAIPHPLGTLDRMYVPTGGVSDEEWAAFDADCCDTCGAPPTLQSASCDGDPDACRECGAYLTPFKPEPYDGPEDSDIAF